MHSSTRTRTPERDLPRSPFFADGACPQGTAEVCCQANLGNNERVSLSEDSQHILGRISDSVCRDHIVELVKIAIKKLVIVEVVVFALPRGHSGRIANQIAMTNNAQPANVLESKDIGVHGGDEQARVVERAVGDITLPQVEVDTNLKSTG